ncbi:MULTISPECIES: transposase [unclassified Thioalkalivibrio]|uniref:transposase n=1 Tax=unclassified Thioalkalivibrio TaxID=2621013 RepID=UPI00036B9C23|nr:MULTISPECIES: transposase [unclassified Thioalkalivibrio]
MTQPRSSLVSIEDTPWYHVVSRCVRRAFLCGEDRVSGQNFEHRREWIETRILELAAIFTIDVAAYAVMSNHYHVVVRLDPERAASLGTESVLQRWTRLFSGPELVRQYLSPRRKAMCHAQLRRVEEYAQTYRNRLADLSWFMRVLNESIARQANEEEGVKGRFWEGRFKSQALLDDAAVLAAMSYVDLNPVRAGMAETLEQSDHTSLQRRMQPETEDHSGNEPPAESSCQKHSSRNPNELRPERELRSLPRAPLMPFDATGQFEPAIPFAFEDYLELTDTLGRCVHPAKRGRIPAHRPRLLDQLGMNAEAFIQQSCHLLKAFGSAIGAPKQMVELAAQRQCRYLRGISAARSLFVRQAA